MSVPAVRVEAISKRYQIGAEVLPYRRLTESIWGGLSSLGRGRRPASKSEGTDWIWALKDVSLEIPEGEVVGIIGRNGAGKSTLLKVLSRITEPTSGRAVLSGRVGSLLEVGTGFHPELTGRENIFLNGAILGMRKKETIQKFDEIVSFAEVERFIDTPVKRYSSGMHVRLAFAVAAHLEPDILIVDEVLAVGDASFQKRCLGKMGEAAAGGRTVLFVSHNMGAIARLCSRGILLEEGRIEVDSTAGEAISRYQSFHLVPSSGWSRAAESTVDKEFTFLEVSATDKNDASKASFDGDEALNIRIRYSVRRRLSACGVVVRLYNSDGTVVFSSGDADSQGVSAGSKEPGVFAATVMIPGGLLAPGSYSVFLAAHAPQRHIYDLIDHAVSFEISTQGSLTSLDGRLGVIAPLLNWATIEEGRQ